ncbi:MAG: site-specific DNA-methyltransferase [Muribaculaceae bacterium]|nr:site-specific DNA-methyltransferase [Muribaculaceae bacterium]
MAQNKINKLELTWIGKEDEPLAIEPRLLIDTPEFSFGEVETGTLPNGKPWPGNMLIHGDNLLALRALEENFTGAVKCIYIDPPYNTGNAFEHYDDSIEHSLWLSLMQRRIQLLYNLLAKDGVLFINLDENEHAYCKVICDEIFGRSNYIGDLIWQKRKGGGNDSRYFAIDHDYILVYAKNKSKEVHPRWYVSQSEEYQKRYKEIDENGNRYFWDTVARNGLKNAIPVEVKCPDGTVLKINSQKSQATIEEGLNDGTVRLTRSKNGWTLHHRVYMSGNQVLRSILTDVGTNKSAGDESLILFENNPFDYPKPEALIEKILELTTKPGDLVLDSFLGSGTTSAVAHKMERRWIGVELGDHAYTHCALRLKKVVEGEQGGISRSVNWNGGGGFKFYELAPSLLNHDKYGNLIINKDYNADMLAAAMAKHQGFTYSPDAEVYWKQGRSSEHDFIFTTTQLITAEMLDTIHEQLGGNESLLICCTKFQPECRNKYSNITIKKIPKVLLDTCEFDRDDYSLNIVSVPEIEDEEWDDFDPEENHLETNDNTPNLLNQ